MELACGRKPINYEAPEDQVVMLEWVRELHGRGVLHDTADQRLGGQFDEQQMNCLLIVGLWCAHFEYDHRPSIKEAIQVLNFEAPLPLLQFDVPRSSHHTPTINDTNSTKWDDNSNSSLFKAHFATYLPTLLLLLEVELSFKVRMLYMC